MVELPKESYVKQCPCCNDGGGGRLFYAEILKDEKATRGFWCDECDTWFSEHEGIYEPSASRPAPNGLGHIMSLMGIDYMTTPLVFLKYPPEAEA